MPKTLSKISANESNPQWFVPNYDTVQADTATIEAGFWWACVANTGSADATIGDGNNAMTLPAGASFSWPMGLKTYKNIIYIDATGTTCQLTAAW